MKKMYLMIVFGILFISLRAQNNQPKKDLLTALVADKSTSGVSFTPSEAVATCTSLGTITRELWANVTGYSVANIPVNSTPTSSSQLTSFEEPLSFGDNYGSRIKGYICAPLTGNYIFWIASDDNSELWLSTNDNPANKIKIASVSGYTSSRQWTKYASQQSLPISLTAGLKYYIEALHKEGSQGDNCAVGWQLPNGTLERPIQGNRLSPFDTVVPPSSNELISAGASWKFLDNGTDQNTSWRNNSFNDSSWLTGNAELGYGDGGETTIVGYGPSSTNKYITTYFRKKINVADLSGITGLELSLIRDDGAVVYINGSEVYRSNMPSGSITYSTFATVAIDGTAESTYSIATISSSSLVVGENSIGVEIHQQNVTSSDISFNLKLKKITSVTGINYTPNVFAIIGDYGWTGPNEAAVANLVKSWNPEYIITTGDNNYRDGADSTIDANIGQYYHDYIKPYTGVYGAGADINRFFPSIGNHDMITSSGAAYLQYFNLFGNERYYDFVKGSVHFFVLNGNPEEVDGITSTSVQALWLKNKLAASTAKWKIVYFHQSPYVSDIVHGNTVEMHWPYKSWGADVVVSGHSHVYERIIIDNFPYFVNGLGGESKYSFSPSPTAGSKIRYNANYGAMQVTVKPDTLWFKFYNVSNNLIESYPIVKSTTPPPPAVCEAKITAGGSTTFCAGGNVTLNANIGLGFSYQWIKNGVNISGATASGFIASAAGEYQVRMSFAGCTSWSSPTKVIVNTSLTAKITPGGATTFCAGANVILYANTCSGYIYQWKKDGLNITGATNATYTANSSGEYQVKIIQGAAVAWSALTKITVNSCTRGADDIILQYDASNTTSDVASDVFHVNVYPNPSTGLFSFELSIEDIPKGSLDIKVVNSLGQAVYTKPAEHISGNIKETIELSSTLPAGIYILQLTIGKKTENTRVLLTR
ncbi:MAG: metallophosphoesterase [Bacteroidota bacterium]